MSVLVVGIAGGTGSGKTTIANKIAAALPRNSVSAIEHDSYYRDITHLSEEDRTQVNFDHPGSLDTPLMIDHLLQLRAGKAVEIPIYDFTTHSRTRKTTHLEPQPVILVEGILIFADPDLREMFDVKIFVDTPPDIRFIRRLERDINERGRTVASVIQQYQSTVRPMHLEFVEPSKQFADVIIPEGGLNTVAMDMMVARIESLLSAR